MPPLEDRREGGVEAVEPVRDNLVLSLDGWPEAGVSLDFALSPAILQKAMGCGSGGSSEKASEVAGSFVFKTAMRGHLDVQVFNKRVRVKGAFAVKVELICDRCLEPFVEKVSDSVDESLKLVEGAAPQAGDPQWDGELEVKGGCFDLAPLMGELFWLALPYKALCRP
ncbi:MAG: DUF177 domain-containing protein, partial [Deltaproteobacteria bacterium]|nr:DUF177 domain-containing protein [Deltaproteobacteria bacterium]